MNKSYIWEINKKNINKIAKKNWLNKQIIYRVTNYKRNMKAAYFYYREEGEKVENFLRVFYLH